MLPVLIFRASQPAQPQNHDLAFTDLQRTAAGDMRVERRERSCQRRIVRSEAHTSELQSLMRISYADFCFKKQTPPAAESRIRLRNSAPRGTWLRSSSHHTPYGQPRPQHSTKK